nr:hypothetical protein [uncultured Agathobaculum sp.]
MQNIDFEQLRKDALESCTANLPDDSIGRMIQKQAELSSKVTAEILKKYHALLDQDKQ